MPMSDTPRTDRCLRKAATIGQLAWQLELLCRRLERELRALKRAVNAAPQENTADANVGSDGTRSGPAVAAPHVQTDRCGFDRNSSISEDTYVCDCGWREHGR